MPVVLVVAILLCQAISDDLAFVIFLLFVHGQFITQIVTIGSQIVVRFQKLINFQVSISILKNVSTAKRGHFSGGHLTTRCILTSEAVVLFTRCAV